MNYQTDAFRSPLINKQKHQQRSWAYKQICHMIFESKIPESNA